MKVKRTRFEEKILPVKPKPLFVPQLKEIKLPERNKPCLCGSGKKFKKCCYIKALQK